MPSTAVGKPLRTRVYIDGYNLYYGCLKGSPYKWLDPFMLFERHILPSIFVPGGQAGIELLPVAIKFFTANILEKAAKALDSVSCQARYHTALRKLYGGRIELVKGYYSLNESCAKLVDTAAPATWPRDCRDLLVWKVEEKQTDVKLALQVYHDAITQQVDHVVVVTNDTDIAPSLELIRTHTGVTVGLVTPLKKHVAIPNTELANLAHWVRSHISNNELAASQLPRVINVGKKPTIKPDSWYARPDLLEQVVQLLTSFQVGRGAAFKWIGEGNAHFGGIAPLDLMDTDSGAKRVMRHIRRAHYRRQ